MTAPQVQPANLDEANNLLIQQQMSYAKQQKGVQRPGTSKQDQRPPRNLHGASANFNVERSSGGRHHFGQTKASRQQRPSTSVDQTQVYGGLRPRNLQKDSFVNSVKGRNRNASRTQLSQNIQAINESQISSQKLFRNFTNSETHQGRMVPRTEAESPQGRSQPASKVAQFKTQKTQQNFVKTQKAYDNWKLLGMNLSQKQLHKIGRINNQVAGPRSPFDANMPQLYALSGIVEAKKYSRLYRNQFAHIRNFKPLT